MGCSACNKGRNTAPRKFNIPIKTVAAKKNPVSTPRPTATSKANVSKTPTPTQTPKPERANQKMGNVMAKTRKSRIKKTL